MDSEHSDFDWNDETYDAESVSPTPSSVEALEAWLEENYDLWELGLQLAATAQAYRRDYRHVPFNKSGWFCPN